MSEDTENTQDGSEIIGEPMTQSEVDAQAAITPADEQSAISWWNEVSSPLFVNALGEG